MNSIAMLLAVAMPSQVFSPQMMLPRNSEVPVWGTALPGERVEVSFGEQRKETIADAEGRWQVMLAPLKALSGGGVLKVRGKANEVSLDDIAVGDVYLTAGQSNMQFPLYSETAQGHDRNGNALVQIANDNAIRFANPPRCWMATPTNDVRLAWGKGTRRDLTRFLYHGTHEEGSISAIGYHFARHLHQATGVPIGFVDVSRGGAFIEPCLAPREAAQKQELKLHCYGAHQLPGVLWNGMIAPLVKFPFKGVVWYQGESNKCCTNGEYLVKFRALTSGWRREFGNAKLPFYFVQLAPHSAGHLSVQLQQAEYEREDRNSAMAVVADIGNLRNIHPTDKYTVGLRLALLALEREYGIRDIEAHSPRPGKVTAGADGKVTVEFDNAKWLYVANDDMSLGADFELQDEQGNWRKAKICNFKETWIWYMKKNVKNGEISGNAIVLQAEGVSRPKAVRYLFNSPWKSSVFNQASLPLGPWMSRL